jgi:DNA invertase Pin-like site-specific DNA recombinase
MEINDLARALSRKKRLGRAGSYRQIARRAKLSVSTVHEVLNNTEGAIKEYDRGSVLRRIVQALGEIEAEQEAETV